MEYVKARRKYLKAKRYYDFFIDKILNSDNEQITNQLNQLLILNCLNCAAVALKLGKYFDAKLSCDDVSYILLFYLRYIYMYMYMYN